MVITLTSWCFWLVKKIISYKIPQCLPKCRYTWLAVDSATEIVVFPALKAMQQRKLSKSVPHKQTFVIDTEGNLSNALVWFTSCNPLFHESRPFSFKAQREKLQVPFESAPQCALWVFTSLPHCQCRLKHLLRHSFFTMCFVVFYSLTTLLMSTARYVQARFLQSTNCEVRASRFPSAKPLELWCKGNGTWNTNSARAIQENSKHGLQTLIKSSFDNCLDITLE